MPRWYSVLKAAKYLGVPPWELAEQNIAWYQMAIAAEGAEMEARSVIRERLKKNGR